MGRVDKIDKNLETFEDKRNNEKEHNKNEHNNSKEINNKDNGTMTMTTKTTKQRQ